MPKDYLYVGIGTFTNTGAFQDRYCKICGNTGDWCTGDRFFFTHVLIIGTFTNFDRSIDRGMKTGSRQKGNQEEDNLASSLNDTLCLKPWFSRF
jgi:hypothetical protein